MVILSEDFRWTAEFARFLEAIGQEGRNDVDLILNGDTFELVNSAAGNCGGPQNTAGCTETEAVARLDAVLKAHDADMKALGQFARAGSNHVVFVPGDQDAALLFPRVGVASSPLSVGKAAGSRSRIRLLAVARRPGVCRAWTPNRFQRPSV